MAKREALSLLEKMREELTRISSSRTQPAAKVRRAQIMLAYSEGKRIAQIAREAVNQLPTDSSSGTDVTAGGRMEVGFPSERRWPRTTTLGG